MEKLTGLNVCIGEIWVFFPSLEKKSPRSVQSLRLAIPKCYVKSYIKLKTKIKIYVILKPVKLVLIGNCMKRL